MRPILFLCLLSACIEQAPIDPVGSWQTSWSWVPGGCNITQAVTDTILVSEGRRDGDASLVITPTDPDLVSATSEIACTDEDCRLTQSRRASVSGVSILFTLDFALDGEDRIQGSGYTTVFGASTCSQNFVATGARL